MRIDRIEIQNFKRFKAQALDLHPQFTLLVGDNGAGKTTLLDALAIAAGVWLVRPPDSSLANSGRNILPGEIRLEPVTKGDRTLFEERKPVSILACGVIAGQPVEWLRQIREDGTRTTNAGAMEALEMIARVYARVQQGEDIVCPVIAYYGAGRAWLPSHARQQKAKSNGPARRWDAFYDCFEERIRLGDLQTWFQREMFEFVNRGGMWRPGFEAVKRAMLRCIPQAADVWFDGDRAEIVLATEHEGIQPFSNFSAGQKMMAALVADIAIKAVTQNAHLLPPDKLGPDDEPWPRLFRETPGLVMIDEIDVHLHPKWQRRVVQDLKDAFPAIQFVATTHSPQTIGEVPPEQIRLLGVGDDPIRRPTVSFGVDSNWILDHVMTAANSRDPEIKKLLAKIEEKLEKGNLSEAGKLITQVRKRLNGEEGELTRLQSSLEALQILSHEDD